MGQDFQHAVLRRTFYVDEGVLDDKIGGEGVESKLGI
jgi:hypothetical protein